MISDSADSIKASVTTCFRRNVAAAQKHELLTSSTKSATLNKLVGDAAEMSQLDAGEFELNLEPVAVNDIVAAALAHCKSLLGRAACE